METDQKDGNLMNSKESDIFKKALIVYAHPKEEGSFCAALRDRIEEKLDSEGYIVTVSSLYELDFHELYEAESVITSNQRKTNLRDNQADDESDYDNGHEENHFKLKRSLEENYKLGILDKRIINEIEKINSSRLVVFVFPMYWGSCPAILKCWFDLCLIRNIAFNDSDGKLYEHGLYKGKKAMIVTSLDFPEEDFSLDGNFKLSVEETYEHITVGTLGYCGFQILPTFCVYETKKKRTEELKEYLNRLEEIFGDLENIEAIFN